MKEAQAQIKAFIDQREWEVPGGLKDLLLNIVEETGEAWNIIKWVDAQKEATLLHEHKDHYEDFVGDVLFLILRIANTAGIDASLAIKKTLEEYEQRFPVNEVKGKTANIHADGIDHKYR